MVQPATGACGSFVIIEIPLQKAPEPSGVEDDHMIHNRRSQAVSRTRRGVSVAAPAAGGAATSDQVDACSVNVAGKSRLAGANGDSAFR